MKITDFSQLLQACSQWLAENGAKQLATELERLNVGLAPYREMTVLQFSEWLLANDPGQQPGETDPGSNKTKPKLDLVRVQDALDKVLKLYERATDPTLTYEAIEATVAEIEAKLNKEDGLELAHRFELNSKFNSKKAAFQAIAHKIKDRKALDLRAQLIRGPNAQSAPQEQTEVLPGATPHTDLPEPSAPSEAEQAITPNPSLQVSSDEPVMPPFGEHILPDQSKAVVSNDEQVGRQSRNESQPNPNLE